MMTNDLMRIYFSDFFEVDPKLLEEYGAFDISLINDLPLFIDPFLLFNSAKSEYRALHDQIIDYLRFLRDKAIAGEISPGLLEAWFTFREVKQNWLGYSLEGNSGTGLGFEFARALNENLARIFTNFGREEVTQGSHLEKLCLIANGVGRDNVSDFATNLIKHFLLEYTQAFSIKHLRPEQRRIISVTKAQFNYSTESWETRRYELPFILGGFVILTPTDMLTKDDTWINKVDIIRDYAEIADSVSNEQLRAQLGNYFTNALHDIRKRDEKEKEERRSDRQRNRRRRDPRSDSEPTKKQIDEAVFATIQHFPEFVDYYIRYKEEHGDEAEARADEKVRSSERLYIAQVRELASRLLQTTEFYRVEGATLDEARQRVAFLKDVIENKGGWRLFYVDGEPIRREADIHILFRLTWCNTPSDVNREVNNGRGPSDFEISRGRFDKSLVEFKLAKNTALARNLQHQAEIYQKASDAEHALKVIVYFTADERDKVIALLTALNMHDKPDIVLIDARGDNKPSASKADGTDADS